MLLSVCLVAICFESRIIRVMKNTALLLGVLIILSGVGWYLYKSVPVAEAPVSIGNSPDEVIVPEDDELPPIVDSFADCMAAGNPIMESYPRQCRNDGQLFVEPIAPEPAPEGEPVACTMEAKICPDGSAVGRTGPNCEFEACPGEDMGSEVITCSPESKQNQMCTKEYAPVCGLVEVQCVTTPCNPVPQTFSNACGACSQGNVVSFTKGACSAE